MLQSAIHTSRHDKGIWPNRSSWYLRERSASNVQVPYLQVPSSRLHISCISFLEIYRVWLLFHSLLSTTLIHYCFGLGSSASLAYMKEPPFVSTSWSFSIPQKFGSNLLVYSQNPCTTLTHYTAPYKGISWNFRPWKGNQMV